MNAVGDALKVRELQAAQRGVFSKADLQTLLGEKHAAAFVRRAAALERAGVVRPFMRGWYVAGDDALAMSTLSQRIAPNSYMSFGEVLARALVIGAVPEREVWAVKTGRSRTYVGLGTRIRHFGVAPHLLFGHEIRDGIRFATPEKAFLDTLYFHLRGQRFSFDIYADLNVDNLDTRVLRSYLERYRNPKFVSFVEGIVNAQS